MQKKAAKPAAKKSATSAKKTIPHKAPPKTKAAPSAAAAKSSGAAKKSTPAPAPAAKAPPAPAATPAKGRRGKVHPGTGYFAQALASGQSESRSKSQLCRVIGCTQPATTAGYSRLCYIKYWRQIKQKDEILAQGTLQRFIRELVDKYPEKVILAIRTDLASNEAYAGMIRDLDLYGGIDELEHAPAQSPDDEDAPAENDLEDIKKGIDKEDDLF